LVFGLILENGVFFRFRLSLGSSVKGGMRREYKKEIVCWCAFSNVLVFKDLYRYIEAVFSYGFD
jgi:hypothetical protein